VGPGYVAVVAGDDLHALGQFGSEFDTCRATADDHHGQILARVRRKKHPAAKKVVERRRLAYVIDEVTVLQDARVPKSLTWLPSAGISVS
jgi:hypothetical protein